MDLHSLFCSKYLKMTKRWSNKFLTVQKMMVLMKLYLTLVCISFNFVCRWCLEFAALYLFVFSIVFWQNTTNTIFLNLKWFVKSGEICMFSCAWKGTEFKDQQECKDENVHVCSVTALNRTQLMGKCLTRQAWVQNKLPKLGVKSLHNKVVKWGLGMLYSRLE